jgi:hypothetical protein
MLLRRQKVAKSDKSRAFQTNAVRGRHVVDMRDELAGSHLGGDHPALMTVQD